MDGWIYQRVSCRHGSKDCNSNRRSKFLAVLIVLLFSFWLFVNEAPIFQKTEVKTGQMIYFRILRWKMRDKGIAVSIFFSLFTSAPSAHPPLSKPQLTAHDYLLQQMSPKSRVTYFIFTKHVIVEHSFLGMPLMDYGLSKMSPRGSSTCKKHS